MANHTTIIQFTNQTITDLSSSFGSQLFTIDLGVFAIILAISSLLAVFWYTKNLAGYMGTGLFILAYAFTLPSFSSNVVIDFLFFAMAGISVFYSGIYNFKKL